jgi:hypothetical protein
MGVMIGAVWMLAGLITIPPLFGWKKENRRNDLCMVSQVRMNYWLLETKKQTNNNNAK